MSSSAMRPLVRAIRDVNGPFSIRPSVKWETRYERSVGCRSQLVQRVVLPHFIELGEGFQQVNVRVHRFVADGKLRQWYALQHDGVRIALHNFAVAREPLKIAAVLRVVGVA